MNKKKVSPVYRNLPRKTHHDNLRKAVSAVLDEMEVGKEFSSAELYQQTIKKDPECDGCFLETVLRYARKYRRELFICISKSESIYKRVEKRIND